MYIDKIKSRVLDRLNESIEANLGDNIDLSDEVENCVVEVKEKKFEFNLTDTQKEILNVITNYADFYDPNVEVKKDSQIKFAYTIHALNHALK